MAGNYYTTVGRAYVVDTLDGTVAVPANHYIAWGTGADAGLAGTALTTEATEVRTAATRSQPAADTSSWAGTIACALLGKTITEAAVMSASSTGTMILYTSFTGVVLAVGETIAFTFTLKQAT